MPIISQPELLGAILKHLGDDQEVENLNERQFNAVIKAANDICDELARENQPASKGSGLAAWLASDDTGLSSRFMARQLAPVADVGTVPDERPWFDEDEHYPRDPADFGRCVRLLDAVPELRPYIDVMAGYSKQWAAIVGAWDELEALYREEYPSGKAPRLYARMEQLASLA